MVCICIAWFAGKCLAYVPVIQGEEILPPVSAEGCHRPFISLAEMECGHLLCFLAFYLPSWQGSGVSPVPP